MTFDYLTITIVTRTILTGAVSTLPIFTSIAITSTLIFIFHDLLFLSSPNRLTNYEKDATNLKIILQLFSDGNWFDGRDAATASISKWNPN